MHVHLSLYQQSFSFNIWPESLTFLINKISAIGKLNDVSHNSSWFLTNDPFFSVVYDRYFPECHVIITTHLNKSVVLVWLL